MRRPGEAFFSCQVVDLLVRYGEDAVLEPDDLGRTSHTALPVYREMLLQVCRDYATLPPIRSMTVDEIVFFYDGLRPELRRATKPK